MKIKKLPFNINFFQDMPNSYAGMLAVQSLQMFEGKNGDFHPQGLYSNVIFGRPGDDVRSQKESYINLKVPIFHPLYFKELIALKGLYKEILFREAHAKWDDKEKDFVRADVLTGDTGYAFFLEHFPNLVLKRNKSQQRDLRIDLLEKFKPQCFIRNLVVIPAGIRDVELQDDGQPKEEDINALYRRVISVSNTVNSAFGAINTPVLDEAKSSMQKAVIEIYDYIFNMLEGKKGFLQGKYASRRVKGSTRNVLSSMEVGSEWLGDERQAGLNTTMVGLFQFMKGCEPWITEYAFRNMYLREFFETINDGLMLIDRKTLKQVPVTLKDKTRDQWATTEGLENIINGFSDATLRHRPVTLDGHYLKLVYQDDKVFKVFNGIDELPEGFERSRVRPISWCELFYIHVKDFIKKTRAFCTRYPVTGLSSIQALEVYVKTTVSGLKLKELDESWEPTENLALEFPDTSAELAFFDTMAISPSLLSGYGADFDKLWVCLSISVEIKHRELLERTQDSLH